jgi:hypothetical protein
MVERQEQAIWLIGCLRYYFVLSVLDVKSMLRIERIVAPHDIETPTELTKWALLCLDTLNNESEHLIGD